MVVEQKARREDLRQRPDVHDDSPAVGRGERKDRAAVVVELVVVVVLDHRDALRTRQLEQCQAPTRREHPRRRVLVVRRDVDRAHQISSALNAGTVWINTYGPTDARLPWGGMGGQSGIGRDLGRSALENYTEQKAVWLQLRARPGVGAAA